MDTIFPYLTPCKYFFWGFLKDCIYCNNPHIVLRTTSTNWSHYWYYSQAISAATVQWFVLYLHRIKEVGCSETENTFHIRKVSIIFCVFYVFCSVILWVFMNIYAFKITYFIFEYPVIILKCDSMCAAIFELDGVSCHVLQWRIVLEWWILRQKDQFLPILSPLPQVI
jgi:hypothetical protein